MGCFQDRVILVVVVVVVVFILLPDFIQLQITFNGNKTANIYVKTVQFIYSVRVKIQTLPLHNVRKLC